MSAAEKYISEGHPTVEELIAEQRVMFPRDPRGLLGDFWPEEESMDDFLSAMREWRGHTKTDPAARRPSSSIRTSFRFSSRRTAGPKVTFRTSAAANG